MANKKYAVHWEEGKATSFEIDGQSYASLDQIPSPKDVRKLKAILAAARQDDDVQPEVAKARTKKNVLTMENMVLNGFTGIAVLMLLIAAISTFRAIATITSQKSAPGRVVDMVVRREYENVQDRIVREYYFPVVEFTADDGRRRSVQTSIGSDSPGYEKGDEVTVLYDPQHPLDAQIKSFGSSAMLWILPGITGILGVCFMGAVLIVQRVMRLE
jgi:hypothetical protein